VRTPAWVCSVTIAVARAAAAAVLRSRLAVVRRRKSRRADVPPRQPLLSRRVVAPPRPLLSRRVVVPAAQSRPAVAKAPVVAAIVAVCSVACSIVTVVAARAAAVVARLSPLAVARPEHGIELSEKSPLPSFAALAARLVF
jgi:hypothetical protein